MDTVAGHSAATDIYSACCGSFVWTAACCMCKYSILSASMSGRWENERDTAESAIASKGSARSPAKA